MAEDRMLNDEILLGLIKANSGGGGGGTTNYNLLENKPQIAGTELQGNKSLADLGIASASALATKQNATDNNLDTDAKTIVGAINEHEGDIDSLKSGLTNLDNEVNGDAVTYPYADVITINDAVPANLADCSVKVEPVQDLHGYDKPWVGGAGKNKLPMTVSGIKAVNTGGTWNGNVYTASGSTATITILTDSDNNVIGIKVDGTFSSTLIFNLVTGTLNGSYILTGCPQGGASDTYRLDARDTNSGVMVTDVGSGTNVTINNKSIYGAIRIQSGTTVSNIIFYPMLRLSTETDATFAPYTNICPISGHTEAVVTREGKNLWVGTFVDDGFRQSDTYGAYDGAANKAGNSETPVIAGEKYTFSINGEEKYIRYIFLDENKADIGSYTNGITIATPSNAKYLKWRSVDDAGGQNVKAQLEIGEIAHAYVPHIPTQTYTLALGDTIYGGTVDFDSGVMTVDMAVVDLGTLNWEIRGIETARVNVSVNAKFVAQNVAVNGVCSCYVLVDQYHAGDYNTCISFNTKSQVYIRDTTHEMSTKEDLQEYLSGNLLCYEMETPTTIQLTPQQIQLLQGQNTLTASTGDISVTVNGVSGSIGAVQEQVNDLQDNVGEINSILSLKTATAGTNITIVKGGYLQIGKLVIIDAIITASENISINNTIISNIPSVGDNNYPISCNDVASPWSVANVRIYYGGVINTDQLTANHSYHLYGSYMCN